MISDQLNEHINIINFNLSSASFDLKGLNPAFFGQNMDMAQQMFVDIDTANNHFNDLKSYNSRKKCFLVVFCVGLLLTVLGVIVHYNTKTDIIPLILIGLGIVLILVGILGAIVVKLSEENILKQLQLRITQIIDRYNSNHFNPAGIRANYHYEKYVRGGGKHATTVIEIWIEFHKGNNFSQAGIQANYQYNPNFTNNQYQNSSKHQGYPPIAQNNFNSLNYPNYVPNAYPNMHGGVSSRIDPFGDSYKK